MKRYFVLFICTFLFLTLNAHGAEYTYRVKILKDNLPLRNDAGGSDGSKIDDLDYGDYYTLVSEMLYDDQNNHLRCNGGWYNITYYTGVTGYVCSDDVDLIKSYTTDDVAPSTACEEELYNNGIPSSYWGGLCKLKSEHPNWTFIGVETNLDWSSAVEKESACGLNYIYSKTYDTTFFDSSCTSTSPGGYVAPSQTALAYYMDPRNFFTEKYIFQFLDESYDSNLESIYESTVYSIISGTSFNNYHEALGNNLANLIYTGSKEYLVSPVFTASRIRQELGSGTSLYNLYSGVTEGYEGYYNFYNIGVTDSCVSSNGTTYCGLTYAMKMGWNSVSSAINGGISFIANNYISQGQYTGYFQKYNVVPSDSSKYYIHQYQSNVSAPMDESKITYKAYKNAGILDSNFIFKIPVYLNMSASISNSSNGAVDDNDNTSKPSSIPISTIVTSSGYNYSSGIISKIEIGTTASSLKGILESVAGNATVSILDANNNAYDGILFTGAKVVINNQSTTEELRVIIKGDTSGDGQVNALDLLQVQKYILGTYSLNDIYFTAGDTSSDGVINALDLLQIQKYILGTYNIEQ